MVGNAPDQKNSNKKQRKVKRSYYSPWTPFDDLLLKDMISEKISLEEIAEKLHRRIGGIKNRAMILGCYDFLETEKKYNFIQSQWPLLLRFENITKAEARIAAAGAPVCGQMPKRPVNETGRGSWWWIK